MRVQKRMTTTRRAHAARRRDGPREKPRARQRTGWRQGSRGHTRTGPPLLRRGLARQRRFEHGRLRLRDGRAPEIRPRRPEKRRTGSGRALLRLRLASAARARGRHGTRFGLRHGARRLHRQPARGREGQGHRCRHVRLAARFRAPFRGRAHAALRLRAKQRRVFAMLHRGHGRRRRCERGCGHIELRGKPLAVQRAAVLRGFPRVEAGRRAVFLGRFLRPPRAGRFLRRPCPARRVPLRCPLHRGLPPHARRVRGARVLRGGQRRTAHRGFPHRDEAGLCHLLQLHDTRGEIGRLRGCGGGLWADGHVPGHHVRKPALLRFK